MTHRATGVITYKLNGREHEWRVDCHVIKDNAETLKKHLERWIPKATFIRCKIIPDDPIR